MRIIWFIQYLKEQIHIRYKSKPWPLKDWPGLENGRQRQNRTGNTHEGMSRLWPPVVSGTTYRWHLSYLGSFTVRIHRQWKHIAICVPDAHRIEKQQTQRIIEPVTWTSLKPTKNWIIAMKIAFFQQTKATISTKSATYPDLKWTKWLPYRELQFRLDKYNLRKTKKTWSKSD